MSSQTATEKKEPLYPTTVRFTEDEKRKVKIAASMDGKSMDDWLAGLAREKISTITFPQPQDQPAAQG